MPGSQLNGAQYLPETVAQCSLLAADTVLSTSFEFDTFDSTYTPTGLALETNVAYGFGALTLDAGSSWVVPFANDFAAGFFVKFELTVLADAGLALTVYNASSATASLASADATLTLVFGASTAVPSYNVGAGLVSTAGSFT